jgi:hypothetical protein
MSERTRFDDLTDPRWLRRGRIFVPRGFMEGEVWTQKGQWCERRYFAMLLNPYRFGGPPLASTYYVNTDGANGDGSIGSPWSSLENARTSLITLAPSLITAALAPTIIMSGATDDTTTVTDTWPTSSTTYYLTIKVPDADRKGQWDTNVYTLVRTTAVGDAVLNLSTDSIRLLGLQIKQTQAISFEVVVRVNALGGELFMDGCKLQGVNGSNAIGIRASGIGGKLVLRNILIFSTVHGILLGNPTGLFSGSEVYIYNSTIWGSGSGGEACQITFASGGSGKISRVKNMMMYAQTNGITVTNADTDDQLTNSKGGVDVSHFVAPGADGDWRLASGSTNRDIGTDLSAVGAGQFQFSEDVSLYTRPFNGVWDRGFYEYRP